MACLSVLEEQVEEQINNLLFELDPVRTHEYICSLDAKIKAHPVVGIAIARAYISDAEYGHAANAIEATNYYELFKNQGWIFEEDTACLALLSAIIEVYRSFQFIRLNLLLNEIEDVYISPRDANSDGTDNLKKSEHFRLRACRETEFLNQAEHDDAQIDKAEISNDRIRLQYIIMMAYATTIELGFRSSDNFAISYKQRHRTLTRYLKRHGKPVLEALFIFVPFRRKLLGGVPAAITFYTSYVQELGIEYYSQKASALINLCEHQMTENIELAALSLDTALSLYVEKDNKFGQMICEYHRIGFFGAKNDAAAECLKLYLSLADRFLELGNHYWYWMSSMRAFGTIANGNSDKRLLSQLEPIKLAMCNQLHKRQDNYQIRRLNIWEAYDWSQHKVSAEQARLRFEQYLVTPSDHLIYPWLIDIYSGLRCAYDALLDHERAVEYAQKYYNLRVNHPYSTHQDRSTARNDLAQSRYRLLQSRSPLKRVILRRSQDDNSQDEEVTRFLAIATSEIADLERWIAMDIDNGCVQLSRKKRVNINEISHILQEDFFDDIKIGKIALYPQAAIENIALDHVVLDLGDVIRLSRKGEAKEGLRLANLKLQTVLNDPVATLKQHSKAYYLCALSYDVATWHKTHPNEILSKEERDKNLEFQVEYMRKHRDICIALGDFDSLLRSTLPFQKFIRSYILLHPNLKPDLIAEAGQYFLEAEKATEMYRKSLLRSHDISTLLKMQRVVSGPLNTQLYILAASFYIWLQDGPAAWIWVQKSRARALFDMVTRHHTSSGTLLSSLEENPIHRDLLASESALAQKVEKGTTDDYLDVKTELESHRQRLMAVPVLEELLGKPATTDSFGFLEGRAIYYHVRDWLLDGTNVVLVTWFVESSSICLMTMDTRSQMVRGRSPLTLKMPEVQEWIKKYLTFSQSPEERARPLEKWSALKGLTVLVEALGFMTQPEDLLVLCPPAELAAIPLHGLSIGDSGLTMIERNPVVYASSFRLYLECICRVQASKCLKDRSLSNAIFTAAYEGSDPLEKLERARIFESIQSLKDTFNASHILGHNLTPAAFKSALQSSPWIHYHGHVHYESTEALNQCYLLSDGQPSRSSGATSPTSPAAASSLTNLSLTDTTTTAPPPHSLLPTHHTSSQSCLRVSDIFALSLRHTSPFICSIACDSGMQDVTAGHEPLGLVSALFCAGASSIVGTLWPIPSTTGTLFTRYFYEALKVQIKELERREEEGEGKRRQDGMVLNVVRALREAVGKLKEEKKDPYSWAGFVLHGAGFYALGLREDRA